MTTLFTVATSEGGSFVCTTPAPRVYLVTFTSAPDNRLKTSFLQALLRCLDIIEYQHASGCVILTSGIAKFFSNGLDLEHWHSTPGFIEQSFYPVLRRLLTYPMPTVALINGHGFAGGLILAMYCDYRIQNPAKGFLCMNEVQLGAVMTRPMTAIFDKKVLSPAMFRTLFLEGKRIVAPEALKEGLVDALGGLEETLAFVKERSLLALGDAGVYGSIKEEMYRDVLDGLESHEANLAWRDRLQAGKKTAKEKAVAAMEAEEKGQSKAKL